MVDQSLWGKHMWHCMHMVALGYPARPTDEEKRRYKQFYLGLQYVLPCTTCAKHYAQNLKTLPIDQYLDNNIRLFEWTVRLHNLVNTQLGKPERTVEESMRYYMSSQSKSAQGWSVMTCISMILALLFAIVALFSHPKKAEL